MAARLMALVQVTGLDFSQALIELRAGQRVRRAAWPDRQTLVMEHVGSPGEVIFAEGEGARRSWLAWQSEILARDWELVLPKVFDGVKVGLAGSSAA